MHSVLQRSDDVNMLLRIDPESCAMCIFDSPEIENESQNEPVPALHMLFHKGSCLGYPRGTVLGATG